MDAFEAVIKTILEAQGYWVRTSFKVELTKAEKQKIGRVSSPRWELDVVAYKPRTNELMVVECKSYLDSRGVRLDDITKTDKKSRYKLFGDNTLRSVVFSRLKRQLLADGLCRPQPTVRLALAAGKVPNATERERLAAHFKRKGWVLYDDVAVKNLLTNFAKKDYENDVATVTAKILLKP